MVVNNNYNLNDEDVVKSDKFTNEDIEIIEDNLVSDEEIEIDPNDKIANLRSRVTHDKDRLNKIITQILRS